MTTWTSSRKAGGWREHVARALWHAHPARPGPMYAALKESQWWPREQLEALQIGKLQRIVEIAARSPWYAERFTRSGVSARDIRTLADLHAIPITERSDLTDAGMEAVRVPGSRGMRARTSGSTGRPVHFLWPLEQMRWLDAGEARARAWMGSDVGTRRLEVRCRPVGRAQELSAVLLNTAAFHAPVVADRAEVRRLVRALAANPPALVWGVSNALYVLAVALLEDGRTVQAGACWSGGNHLHAHYARAFAQAFSCDVYERYATMETGLIAHECVEGRSLHIPAEGLLVEIARPDGTAAAPGETGDVLITALHNTATPFIRYRIGDRAVAPEARSCSCGRGLPLFGRVAGRTADFLRLPDGGMLSPSEAVAVVAPGTGSLLDFQIVQQRDGRLRVSVVQCDSDSSTADRERVGSIVNRLLQPPEPAVVQRVDSIPLTPGGKLRTLVAESWANQ